MSEFFKSLQTPPQVLADAFQQHGAVGLKQAIDPAQLQLLRNDIDGLLKIADPSFDNASASCKRLDATAKETLYQVSLNVEKLAAMSLIQASLISAIKHLFPQDMPIAYLTGVVLFGLPKDERLTYDWHQEVNYVPGIEDNVLTCWFPVYAPATRDNGAFSVLLGSHREGRLAYNKQSKPNGYTELVPKDIDSYVEKYEEMHCVCELGDLVIFDKHTIHRSNYNRSDEVRFSGSMQFVPMTKLLARTEFDNSLY